MERMVTSHCFKVVFYWLAQDEGALSCPPCNTLGLREGCKAEEGVDLEHDELEGADAEHEPDVARHLAAALPQPAHAIFVLACRCPLHLGLQSTLAAQRLISSCSLPKLYLHEHWRLKVLVTA